jgi:hypothetical protein
MESGKLFFSKNDIDAAISSASGPSSTVFTKIIPDFFVCNLRIKKKRGGDAIIGRHAARHFYPFPEQGELMADIRELIRDRKLTQATAAESSAQSARVSDLNRANGKNSASKC